MKRELEEKLAKDFPNVFVDLYGNPRETCMAFGIECLDGWEPIIRKACEKLERVIIQFKKDNPNEEYFPKALQIKEKYGTLSFYLTFGNDEIWKIINEAEFQSTTTCEQCGKKGRLRGHNWLYTSCIQHSKWEDLTFIEKCIKLLIYRTKDNK